MDFLRTRTETTVPPRAPSATTREREERERESCLHCEPDLRLTVTQLLRRDDSCLALQFFFCHPSNRFQFALYAQSWFWRAGELLSPRPQLHAEKYRKKKSLSSVSHSPTLAQSVFFFSFFYSNCSEVNRSSEPCPGRRQWRARVAPRAPRRRRAAGGRGKVWPPPPLRPPDSSIPADRPSATAGSFMTSPSRWAQSSDTASFFFSQAIN